LKSSLWFIIYESTHCIVCNCEHSSVKLTIVAREMLAEKGMLGGGGRGRCLAVREGRCHPLSTELTRGPHELVQHFR
jgi:hypothetical protein